MLNEWAMRPGAAFWLSPIDRPTVLLHEVAPARPYTYQMSAHRTPTTIHIMKYIF